MTILRISRRQLYHVFTVFIQSGARELDTSANLKDQAVEAILVRWHYIKNEDLAIEWPPKEFQNWSLENNSTSDYFALPGFPGVKVGVSGDACGIIDDKRPVYPRPSKAYLMTLRSETLGKMWKDGMYLRII